MKNASGMRGFRIVPYGIPVGCIGAYLPEANPLIPLDHHDNHARAGVQGDARPRHPHQALQAETGTTRSVRQVGVPAVAPLACRVEIASELFTNEARTRQRLARRGKR